MTLAKRPILIRTILLIAALACGSAVPVTAAPFDPNWGAVGVFSDAQGCASCHRASTDQDPGIAAVMRNPLNDSGDDISPSQQWTHSVMAHAFNDPYYRAKVEDESAIFPALSGFIEDKCLTCHAPMAHTNAHQTNTDLTVDASCAPPGCYRLDTADTQDHAREGVSCTLCHQIKADNLGTSASFSGIYSIAAAADPDAFRIFGPHANPVTQAMVNNTAYTPEYGNHVSDSGHCATCHTLYTPVLDADTDVLTGNEFLEQGPFLEWQNSVYFTGNPEAQQCQDCHMPEPEAGIYSTRVAVRPNGTVNETWPVRSPFFTHSMTGGNTYLLELLRDNRQAIGIENSTSVAGFDAKIAETRQLLQNATASLAISRADVNGSELDIDVTIVNKTGHKLPTGFPSRRMWLHLTVRDASNQLIFESGAVDATGRLSTDADRLAADCLAVTKPPGFDTDDCYEPHRDIIDDASEIAIYETVMGDTNSNITHVLLHADTYLKDNRIPPKGFTNAQASSIESQTLPAGIDNDTDFNNDAGSEGSGSDSVHYQIDLNTVNGPYTVDAELLYQTVQPAFIDSMHSNSTRVNSFKNMVQQNPPTAELLASSNAVSTDSTPPADETDSNISSGSGGGGGCSLHSAQRTTPRPPALLLAISLYLALRLLTRGLHKIQHSK